MTKQGKYIKCCYCGAEKYKLPYELKKKNSLFCSKLCSSRYKAASKEFRDKISVKKSGSKNYNWKGGVSWYRSIHFWIKREKGAPRKCVDCGITNDMSNIQWSNKNHRYKKVLSDWQSRCVICHQKYDIKHNNFKRYGH